MVSEAISKGDLAALNYFIAEKYVRAIDALAHSPSTKTFIMPLDMASLAGTLGGIAEIARSATSENAKADASRPAPRSSVPPMGGK